MSGEIDESSVNQMSAADERDLLARQRDAVLEYCQRVDRNGGGGYVRTDVIHQLVVTDPEDDERPWFADVDVAVVQGVVQLLGDGGKLIANLPGDRPEILRDMLVDGIRERDRQARQGSDLPVDAAFEDLRLLAEDSLGNDGPQSLSYRLAEGVVQLLAQVFRLERSESAALVLAEGKIKRFERQAETAGYMPVSTLPDLVERLRQARHERGLTQRDVAEVLRVDHSSVSHWEIGLARPTAGGLIAWARLVGMPLWAIPDREELTDA